MRRKAQPILVQRTDCESAMKKKWVKNSVKAQPILVQRTDCESAMIKKRVKNSVKAQPILVQRTDCESAMKKNRITKFEQIGLQPQDRNNYNLSLIEPMSCSFVAFFEKFSQCFHIFSDVPF